MLHPELPFKEGLVGPAARNVENAGGQQLLAVSSLRGRSQLQRALAQDHALLGHHFGPLPDNYNDRYVLQNSLWVWSGTEV